MSDSCCGGTNRVHLCPSAPAKPGAILLGLVTPNGQIAYLTPQMRIDEDFVDVAAKGRSPEKRFRFASTCVEAGCAQWTGSRCGVIEAAVAEAGGQAIDSEDSSLPKCSIRSRCRWFHQRGRDACGVCPLIITDRGGETGSV
ncbi:hypothetical protein [Mycobacterium sp. OAE908]|uniref:hypothetical protein n=1 Tax=Mycobacterium sp. OAE908 TaxID=2817899 RepID=UPI001AE98FC8